LCVSVCVCVCVYARERHREREIPCIGATRQLCVCVCVCVWERERHREREIPCIGATRQPSAAKDAATQSVAWATPVAALSPFSCKVATQSSEYHEKSPVYCMTSFLKNAHAATLLQHCCNTVCEESDTCCSSFSVFQPNTHKKNHEPCTPYRARDAICKTLSVLGISRLESCILHHEPYTEWMCCNTACCVSDTRCSSFSVLLQGTHKESYRLPCTLHDDPCKE